MATITKRKWTTGKGEAREAWVLAYTDKAGARHKEQFAKKRDAEAKRVEVEGQIASGTFRSTGKTVADAIDAYAASLEQRHARGARVGTGHLRNTRALLDKHVRPRLGSTKLSDLTKGSVVEVRDAMEKGTVGVVTIRRTLGAVSRVMKFAAERDWIATNPAQGITVVAAPDPDDGKVTPPSRQALAAIIAAADPEMSLRVRFAAATGLRASEQWALRWADIDLGKKRVNVGRTVDIYGAVSEKTKSAAGKRSVPLSSAMAAELRARRGEPASDAYKGDSAYVFPDREGGFTRHTNFLRRSWAPLMEKILAKAKEAEEEFEAVNWHALRHFAISTWVLSGMNLKAVQKLAGHATFAMTSDRYSHLLPEDSPDAMFDKLGEGLEAPRQVQ